MDRRALFCSLVSSGYGRMQHKDEPSLYVPHAQTSYPFVQTELTRSNLSGQPYFGRAGDNYACITFG